MVYFFLFKKFLKARWIYKKPKHKKFILYDLAHSNYLLNYIRKENTAIYHTRGEEINFFVLYKAIISFGLRNIRKNYKKIFFDYIKPRVVVTMMSNYTAFYELKNEFPNITTIAIQNDLGNENFFKILKNQRKNSFSCDYFLFFSSSFRKKIQRYICVKKKSFIIGSFRNNFHKYKSLNNKKILFISKCNKGQTALNEILLLKQIIKYLIKNKAGKIDISLKTKDPSIINYFKNNLNKDFINIIPKKNNYSLIQKYKNIIFTDSTLGYECLAKGKKIISFGLGSLNKNWCIKNGFNPINKFGYPAKFNDNGFCWSNKSSKKDINNLLKSILSMRQSTFDKKVKNIREKIMDYDPENSKFKRLLCVV